MSLKTDTQSIDYKKALESASRGMIMIHDPEVLIKLIIRMIVGKVKLKHAGVIIHEPGNDRYVLRISKGETGHRIPPGFARFESSSPLIKIFTDKRFAPLIERSHGVLSYDIHRLIWQEGVLNGKRADPEVQQILHHVSEQMQLFNVVACIPATYHHDLLAVLLLGEKRDGEKFNQEELDFFSALASDSAMAIRNAQLFEKLRDHAERNHDLFLRMTHALGAAIEAKDEYTKGHSEGVTRYAVALAEYMRDEMEYDFSEKFMEDIFIASTLHDIGKIGVPESILNKPGRLTPEEFALIKRHPVDGVEILSPLSELKESMSGIRYHHERYDGTGYPDGLKGEDIPLIASIIAVADCFDAMITRRPYREPSTVDEAIQEILANRGTQFHPVVVDAMAAVFKAGLIS
ncbi:MAG: HD-GYP domain-containing protein [Candidatus Omnitrophota bacterium]